MEEKVLKESFVERVKIFSAFQDPKGLEKEINKWLRDNPKVNITRREVVASGDKSQTLTITIFYMVS